MRYIDTSFVLCLLLKKPTWAYKLCRIMVKDIKTKKIPTAISILTFFETIGTLTRRENWDMGETISKISEIREEIDPLILDFKDEDILEKTFQNWKKYTQCGFFDCCHYSVMETCGITDVYATDSDFDSFPDIKRVRGESEISP